MFEFAMPTVWEIIEEELHRRRKSSAWLGQQIDPPATRQTINGWKVRGVPPGRYEDIARFLGWTVDRLLTGEDSAEAAAANAAHYSPHALHIARMFDDLDSSDAKMRVFWKVSQLIATADCPPWAASQSTPPEHAPAQPVQQPICLPRMAR